MSKVTTFGAAGRVSIGFSKPYVANYAANQGSVTFSQAQVLARGVNVKITPDTASDNNFYADNQLAESAAGTFSGGSFTLTVDGLLPEAERFIMGLPARDGDGWLNIGDNQIIPNVALAYVAKYMCNNVEIYRAEILMKTKFNQIGGDYATQADEINWHTQELSGVIMRADDANHNWKLLGDDFTTEAEAENQLITKLGGTTTRYVVSQTLSNVTSSYSDTLIDAGENFSATLAAADGYTIANVIVMEDGEDVTASAWTSGTGTVAITSVSGNISIIATATNA